MMREWTEYRKQLLAMMARRQAQMRNCEVS